MKPRTTVPPTGHGAARPRQSDRIGYRIAEWSALTGTSRVTTWRNIRSGALKVVNYNGIPIIPASERVRLGFEEV